MLKPAVLFILSASFCDPELQAEFGPIPACCVPIGPNRLVDLQVKEAWDSIDNLQHVFVALPIEKHCEARLVQGGSIWNVHMDSESMDATFHSLLQSFKLWCKVRKAQGAVFDDDEWIIHVLNGDTLIKVDKTVMNLEGTFNINKGEDTQPFVMSKEFDKPDTQCEYAGRLAFKFSHSSEAAYTYTELVRQATKIVIASEGWLDFGHLQTYYRSKRSLLSSRAFNTVSLEKETGHIRKSGQSEKIKAEKEWYRMLPPFTAMYTPRVVINNDPSYLMEYLPYPTLAELLVHGSQGTDFWAHIADKLETLLDLMREEAPHGIEFPDGLFLTKTKYRCVELSDKIRQPAEQLIEWLEQQKLPHNSAVLHGDLCFSNILYDRRSDSLKIIDPRGITEDGEVFGNQLYDVAKLYHSSEGMYDFAVAGSHPKEEANKARALVSDKILHYAQETLEVDRRTLTAVTALLFYSMLPLHRDDMARVHRLSSAGQRLYNEWLRLGR